MACAPGASKTFLNTSEEGESHFSFPLWALRKRKVAEWSWRTPRMRPAKAYAYAVVPVRDQFVPVLDHGISNADNVSDVHLLRVAIVR